MIVNSIADIPEFEHTPLARELINSPLGFIDVGARGDVHELVAPLARHVGVMGFEPDVEECMRLRTLYQQQTPWHTVRFESIALAGRSGIHKFYRQTVPTNDSLRRVNVDVAARYNMVKFIETGCRKIKASRLDDILFSRRQHLESYWGEFIKLDTQGTEYEILKGAKKTLQNRTLGVVCEVAFFDIYRGQKLFSDIEKMMRKLGFSFYGFTMLILRSGKRIDKRESKGRERYMYADAAFLKDPYAGNTSAPTLNASQRIRLLCIALLLQYYDLCMELAADLWHGAVLAKVQDIILQVASVPPAQTLRRIEQLADSMRDQPDFGNVLAGRFVKSQFGYFDYDDVIIE